MILKLVRGLLALSVIVVLSMSTSAVATARSALQETLFDAVKSNNLEVAQHVLEQGANPNYHFNFIAGSRNSYLEVAQYFDESDMIALLVKHGANVNYRDGDGATALTWAYALNNMRAFRALLENGANPNTRDRDGAPILVLTAQALSEAPILELLAHHPDVNLTTRLRKNTALMLAASNCKTFETFLVKAGAKKQMKNREGYTAYDLAIKAACGAEILEDVKP